MTEDSLHYDGTLAVIGGGRMGEAIVGGLVRSGAVPATSITVAEPSAQRREALAAAFGVRCVADGAEALPADTVILAVKPQVIDAVAAALSSSLADSVVVSIAVGITCARLEAALPSGTAVVRVMPNTPALVDEGMAACAPGAHCDQAHLDEARQLLEAVGRVVVLEEKHLDAVTAISGSGPAYFFYIAEAMIEAGVFLGLPRSTATELVVQTCYGAATMLRETGEHPSVLRENVTSPGGTTVAALRTLDDHKVRAAFISALEAARDRSRDLASGS